MAADLCESEARLGYVSSRRAMALSQQTNNNKTTDEEVLRKQREWKVDPGLAEQQLPEERQASKTPVSETRRVMCRDCLFN